MTCAACHRDKVCEIDRGRPLCNDCWHTDREREPCFWLRDRTRADVAFYLGDAPPTGHTRAEAEARVKSFENSKTDRRLYTIVPGDWAHSGRIAHSGYMVERRAAVMENRP